MLENQKFQAKSKFNLKTNNISRNYLATDKNAFNDIYINNYVNATYNKQLNINLDNINNEKTKKKELNKRPDSQNILKFGRNNKTSYQIKENKIINFIKNSNKQNKNNKKPKKIKCKEYSHSIIRKKKILNNSLASNKNLYINSLNISNLIIKSKKNFEKSLSLNYLENGTPKLNKFKKEKNNTAAEFNIRPKNNKNVKTFSFTPKNNSKIK